MEPFLPKRQYGNETLYRMLTAAAGSEHLCHAYLLHGPAGTGKRTLAKRLAASILCTGEKRPCGVCASCVKLAHSSHPDFFYYEGKRGANAIHIDFVRWMRQDAFVKPNDGAYKVYLIPYAEDFSTQAANALLKVLEEPPAHAVFILTADRRERVIETIRSRCIQLAVYPADEDTIRAFVRERSPGISEAECARIAALANGSMGQAACLLSGEDAEYPALALQIAKAYATRQEYALLCALQKAASTRESLRTVLEQTIPILRGAMRGRATDRMAGDAIPLSLDAAIYGIGCVEEALAGIELNGNAGLLAMRLAAVLIEKEV